MESIEEHLLRLEKKIEQLLRQYHLSQKEAVRLQKENAKLQQLLQQQNQQVIHLQQKVDSLKLNQVSVDDDSKKELEKRINGYLKEIDKCLSLLNT